MIVILDVSVQTHITIEGASNITSRQPCTTQLHTHVYLNMYTHRCSPIYQVASAVLVYICTYIYIERERSTYRGTA